MNKYQQAIQLVEKRELPEGMEYLHVEILNILKKGADVDVEPCLVSLKNTLVLPADLATYGESVDQKILDLMKVLGFVKKK